MIVCTVFYSERIIPVMLLQVENQLSGILLNLLKSKVAKINYEHILVALYILKVSFWHFNFFCLITLPEYNIETTYAEVSAECQSHNLLHAVCTLPGLLTVQCVKLLDGGFWGGSRERRKQVPSHCGYRTGRG